MSSGHNKLSIKIKSILKNRSALLTLAILTTLMASYQNCAQQNFDKISQTANGDPNQANPLDELNDEEGSEGRALNDTKDLKCVGSSMADKIGIMPSCPSVVGGAQSIDTYIINEFYLSQFTTSREFSISETSSSNIIQIEQNVIMEKPIVSGIAMRLVFRNPIDKNISITLNITNEPRTDGTRETYSFNLFTSDNKIVGKTWASFVNDINQPNIYYIEPQYTYSKPPLEGDDVVFKIKRSNPFIPSTIFLNTTPDVASQDDFEKLQQVPFVFNANDTELTVRVKTYWDTDYNEKEEPFWVDIYTSLSEAIIGTNPVSYQSGVIQNKGKYSIYSSNPSNEIIEGDKIILNVSRNPLDLTAGSAYYSMTKITPVNYNNLESGFITSIAPVPKLLISFLQGKENTYFIVPTTRDNIPEKDEYFIFKTFKDKTSPEDSFESSIIIKVKDYVAPPDFQYEITSSTSTVLEGSKAVFTIERKSSNNSNLALSSTIILYADCSNSPNQATAGVDYLHAEPLILEFGSNETRKSFPVYTYIDNVPNENNEVLCLQAYSSFLDLFSNKRLSESSPVTIAENNISFPKQKVKYSVELVPDGPITESSNSKVRIKLKRSGDNLTSSYSMNIRIASGSAIYGSDFNNLYKEGASSYYTSNYAVLKFKVNQESSEVLEVNIPKNSGVEPEEFFWVEVYKTDTTSDRAKSVNLVTARVIKILDSP